MSSPQLQPGQQRQPRVSRRGMLDSWGGSLRSQAGLAASLLQEHGTAIATVAALAGWALFIVERARVARLQRRLAEGGSTLQAEAPQELSKRSAAPLATAPESRPGAAQWVSAAPPAVAPDSCPPTEHEQVHAALQQRLLGIRGEVVAAEAEEQQRRAVAAAGSGPASSSPELLAAAEQELMDLQEQLEMLHAEIQSCSPKAGSPTGRTREMGVPEWYNALRASRSSSSSPERHFLLGERLLGARGGGMRGSRSTSMTGFAQRLAPLEVGDEGAADAEAAFGAAAAPPASPPGSPDVFRLLCSQADTADTTWLVDATVATHHPAALVGAGSGNSVSPGPVQDGSPQRASSSPLTYRFHLLGLLASPKGSARSVASTPGAGAVPQQLGPRATVSTCQAQRSWSMPNSPTRPRAAISVVSEQPQPMAGQAREGAEENAADAETPGAAGVLEASGQPESPTVYAAKQQQAQAVHKEQLLPSRSPGVASERCTPMAAAATAAEGQWRPTAGSKIPKRPPSHPGTPTGYGSMSGTPTAEGPGDDFRISSMRSSSTGFKPARIPSASSSPAGVEGCVSKLAGRHGPFTPVDASSKIPKPARAGALS